MSKSTDTPGDRFDVVVVGAGFAGLHLLHRLRGMGLSVRVFEAASGVGGTWFWNRYPGARCDIESMEYSYQFSAELQQEWEWTERYATQPEILRYIEHVTERFELLRDVQLETRVLRAAFDDTRQRWEVETDRGPVSATHCVMATGCLSSAHMPDFPGIDQFAGDIFHTGRWPHEGVDFTGKRVGVIGTGSSAVQSIPIIAEQAEQLTVFQRTATYAVPAHNHPLDPGHQEAIKARYPEFRAANRQTYLGFGSDYPAADEAATEASPEEREARYQERWGHGGLAFMGAYRDLLVSSEANESASKFVRGKIRSIVEDATVAELLSPDQVLGCKRLCVDTGYYDTFNRPNVSLVDVSETPIEGLTERGLQVGGSEYEFDAIVFATGFDAMTGALQRIDIRGRDGLALAEKWARGPRTYLGLGTAGFPNLFIVTGPGSPSVLTNMLPSIEQHVEWIADCIDHLRANDLHCVEATKTAEDEWVAHVNQVADLTLFPSCNSWYLGANVPGKPRVFMPYLGFASYVAKCEEVAARGYEGFALS
ncbi:MAG: NAD(P)/FAD-dependent oxidoreductase [Deltaproteobacteria bacterium]|nr:NAD(P)/FAD-dependent oxidoreductase [Deltaproteobacteria bacterium]